MSIVSMLAAMCLLLFMMHEGNAFVMQTMHASDQLLKIIQINNTKASEYWLSCWREGDCA